MRSNDSKLVDRSLNLMTVAAVLSKIGSGITQIFVGWYLVPEEFALFAAAMSAQLVAAGMRDAGVGRYLVQKGEYTTYAPTAAVFALVVNAIGIALIFCAIPAFSSLYNQPQLLSVVGPIALCVPFQAFATIYRSKLRIDMRFDKVAKIEVSAAFVQYACTIFAASMSFGVYSLVLGAIAGTLAQFIIGRSFAGKLMQGGPISLHSLAEMWRSCRWIIVSAFLLVLSLRGDYLVLGAINDKSLVGEYYFGFQVAFSLAVILVVPLQSVYLPKLSQILRQGEDGVSALQQAADKLAFKSAAASFAAALVAPEAFNLLWAGKWDGAVGVFMAVMLTTPVFVMGYLSGVFLEAHGKWRNCAWLMAMQAGIIVGAAIISLIQPRMWFIVAWMVAGRVAIAILQLVYVHRITGKTLWGIVGSFGRWQTIFGSIFAAAWILSATADQVLQSFSVKVVVMALCCAAVGFKYREEFHSVKLPLRR